MKTKPILFLFLFVLGCTLKILANQEDTVAVHLKTRATGNSVKLRWIVEKPHLWKMMNSRGFIIERYTDVKEGQSVPEREKKLLTPVPLRTATLDSWEDLSARNAYAAVIAQALYGETFQVTGLSPGNPDDLIQVSQESEQRYSFALYAADMCFEAACLAGWGYEDKDVRPGECYLYRVIPVEIADMPFRYGFDYVCMDEYRELPAPLDLKAEFGDKTVSLSWNGALLKNYFVSYQVEKSEDNDHFEALSMPVTSLNEDIWGHSSFVDSLAENNRTYYYRIRGISPFGEVSEPSDTVQGQGKPEPKFYPKITRSVINTSGKAELEWEFDLEGESFIDYFALERSPDGNKQYETIIENIEKSRRLVETDSFLSSNYFAISAVSSDGNRYRSYPILLMPPDSVPPAPPTGLKAEIDTLGTLHLQWEKNKEPDLLGYKVLRSYRDGDEPVQANAVPVEMENFTDTVDLYNLNEFVYYQVIAFDRRYNQSLPSSMLKVPKPLKVKPAPPVLSSYHSAEEGIRLSWENNPDDWIARHVLYRRHPDSIRPLLIKEFPDRAQTSFTDSLVESRARYIYTLTAISRWGVESDPSPGLCVIASPSARSECINGFQAKPDEKLKQMVLSWKTRNPEEIASYKIYRSVNDNPVSLWKKLPGNVTHTEDTDLQVGSKYRYLIHAVLKNGRMSDSKEYLITY